jgi:peroxiredoxin
MGSASPKGSPAAAVFLFVTGALIAVGAMTEHWVVSGPVHLGLTGEAPLTSIQVFGYLTVATAIATLICAVTAGALMLAGHAARVPVRAMQLVSVVFLACGATFVIRTITFHQSTAEELSLWPGWSAVLAGVGAIVTAITLESLLSIASAKRAGMLTVMAGVSGLVVAMFLWMVPSAAAREVQAACKGMNPTWSNPAFEELPTEAPDFTLQDVDGKTVKLSDYRGKVVLVNFWASWCDVCKAEKRSMTRLAREMQGDDFVILSVASDSELDAIDRSMRVAMGSKNKPSRSKWGGAPFRILRDPPGEQNLGEVATAWGLEKVPETFLIDRDGKIRMYLVNKRDWSAGVVETCVQSLIDE